MQTELLNTRNWITVEQLGIAIADYIEKFHNTRRRHSALGMLTLTDFATLNTPQLHMREPGSKTRLSAFVPKNWGHPKVLRAW